MKDVRLIEKIESVSVFDAIILLKPDKGPKNISIV